MGVGWNLYGFQMSLRPIREGQTPWSAYARAVVSGLLSWALLVGVAYCGPSLGGALAHLRDARLGVGYEVQEGELAVSPHPPGGGQPVADFSVHVAQSIGNASGWSRPQRYDTLPQLREFAAWSPTVRVMANVIYTRDRRSSEVRAPWRAVNFRACREATRMIVSMRLSLDEVEEDSDVEFLVAGHRADAPHQPGQRFAPDAPLQIEHYGASRWEVYFGLRPHPTSHGDAEDF